MIWTMPRPVLQWVAGLLGAGALSAFTLGIVNAPERGGRLPGQPAPGHAGPPATVINAADATPLSQERIEAPAPAAKPANKTDTSDQSDNADQADTPAPPPKAINATPPPTSQAPPPTDAPAPTAPPPEEPPH